MSNPDQIGLDLDVLAESIRKAQEQEDAQKLRDALDE
jgi:hypothetical protein